MIVDCVSDLHGHLPRMEGGDLLIVAGDLTARDQPEEYEEFGEWLDAQPYSYKVVISGNHDNDLDVDIIQCFTNAIHLHDRATSFQGLKIFGSPWTPWFEGVNPRCQAYMLKEKDLQNKWKTIIPEDVDILVTHGPPYGILDEVKFNPDYHIKGQDRCVGDKALRNVTLDGTIYKKKKLHVFGHIHEQGGKFLDMSSCIFVNASIVNEDYKMVNKPVRIVL